MHIFAEIIKCTSFCVTRDLSNCQSGYGSGVYASCRYEYSAREFELLAYFCWDIAFLRSFKGKACATLQEH